MTKELEDEKTAKTRSRYDRIAPIYDLMEGLIERLFFRKWRKELIEHVKGKKILEVGVGTGKNVPYYPPDIELTAIDLSQRMIDRAKTRAKGAKFPVTLNTMNVENLQFSDNHFDTTLATFVFCSVPDPVKGLREMARVTKPDGKILLLEHMRPNNEVLGAIFDIVNPLSVRLLGPNINRETVKNIQKAGLTINTSQDLTKYGIVKLIEAKP